MSVLVLGRRSGLYFWSKCFALCLDSLSCTSPGRLVAIILLLCSIIVGVFKEVLSV